MPNFLQFPQISRSKIKEISDQFVDRGDASAYDFTTTDFTTDGNWHDLDLSPFVPSGSSLVLFSTAIKDDIVGTYISFREKGNVNTFNSSLAIILIANMFFTHYHTVSLDINSTIQYSAANTTFTDLYLSIRGWWI